VSTGPQFDFPPPARSPWTDTPAFHILLRRSLVILLFCGVLVTVAYFFLDKPVAYFVHDQGLNKYEIFDEYKVFELMTYIPIVLEMAASLLLVLAVVQLTWKPLTGWEWICFAAAVNLCITLVLKDHLKFAFGRYWPDTWIENNPSLLKNGAYGFHPFHEGMAYASFPSGHTARIFAMLSVIWIAAPRWRWACVLVCGAVMIGLVGMNYHFVGDVIGGAGLGYITGMYAAHFFQLGVLPAVPPFARSELADRAGA
jgi:hypothetical protein